MRVLVTGANGFVGRVMCESLTANGHVVVPAVRRVSGLIGATVVGNISGATDWTAALTGCNAVVHLAARVHMMNDGEENTLALYRATNLDATLNLARQAAEAGVKRFVFISTVKVHGEGFPHPRPFSKLEGKAYVETDAAAPKDGYAISKWEAEQGLADIARQTGLEVVVLRPPLVYGPGVGANFLRLTQAVERGLPLPFGAIRNRRSLLYLGNFIHAIRLCIEQPAAAGQTFLLDDGQPVSTPGLIHALACAMGRAARLLAVPVWMLEAAGSLLGRRAAVARLTGSLVVDSSAIRSRLGWTPLFTMQQGLAETVGFTPPVNG